MDKKLLKDFAMKSRETLTALVAAKLQAMHVTEDIAWVQKGEVYQAIIDGRNVTLYPSDKDRYDKLRAAVKAEGIKQITEKAAYTWFNRIVAIRYMELREMLPQGKHNEWLGIRVLSDGNNEPDPEILKISNLRRADLDLPLNADDIIKLPRDDQKFREVLFAVVKKLGAVMPDVFNGDTTSINFLLPDNLLGSGGFVNEILKLPVECFDRVEVIGWLYQYYNQAEKDIAMKKKSAVEKDEIPYVTQIFTPDWIVKYMVENSLGRYWLEHGGDPKLADNWKYLIKSDQQVTTTKTMPNIEDVTFIDPCMGSGHILVYAFEVFYQIYRSLGYAPEQIPEKILSHNIYGLDIDDRAKQLSILSAMLVAREYDKDIFSKDIQLNITSVAESNGMSSLPDLLKGASKDTAEYLLDAFRDAKEYGSILRVKSQNYTDLQSQLEELSPIEKPLYYAKTKQLIHQADILSKKYTIAVTNPPYMNKYDAKLKAYIGANYPETKSDMYSVFMEVLSDHLVSGGRMAMVTPDSWMSLTGQAKLRERLENEAHISSMIHLGNGAFPDVVVSTTAFTLVKGDAISIGDYIRDVTGNEKTKYATALAAIDDPHHPLRYRASNADFEVFPGKIIAYWASEAVRKAFVIGVNLRGSAWEPRQGAATSDNNRFLRLWYEVNSTKTNLNAESAIEATQSAKKWFPYNKGGEFRKWYGNNDFLINYENDGEELKGYAKSLYKSATRTIKSISEYFKPSITWSKISSGSIAFRYKPAGHIFDVAGTSIFADDAQDLKYLQGVLNSSVILKISSYLSPTLNFEVGQIATYPIIQSPQYRDEVIRLVEECRELSKADWDAFETSWDFERHPLLPTSGETKLSDMYAVWESTAEDRWSQLKANEERLNEIFIEVYGMQGELTPEVEDKYVSVRKADQSREARSLLSYFVGVIFGRYSLDSLGLNFAGGEWDASAQGKLVDEDNIVPIMDGEYYTDDIVKKLRDFLVAVYGEATLHANMDWLANALGRKSHENAEDTLRRYFVDDFFADHFKVYGKRPIYWQLSSGKQNGFKALFYLHRYQPNLVATVRTQYLLNTQNIYTKRLAELEAKTTLNNDELRLKNDLVAKLAEIKSYDALIGVAASEAIELDLDDGVKTNYPKLSHAAAGVKPGSEILETKGVKL
ncbi:MAG: BREX-1 system adenine-specific DNA-methyltransferase PglX [Candidatus Nomurabacteria bacterium]|nr:MAG: BREX-1 system adenine-specific DNA-methyltransferase PglX [Candidatus Nomurabacteria bacterium]